MPLQEAVTRLVNELVGSWNRGDASAFASLFTADADYVTGAGAWLRGRQAIADLLRTTAPPPRVLVEGKMSVHDDGEVGSVVFRWVTEPGAVPVRRGVVTCVVVRRGEAWLIDRLHNTDES